ncbi:hypothetical protein [Pseudomonas kitaguniensis]|uniref:hypothetical protein n=1 Tax=Pseudomonas kitaguniensis TaxID=2607908 RepID=UPI003D0202E7
MSLFGRFLKGKTKSGVTAEQPPQATKSGMPVVKGDFSRVTEAVKADLWQAVIQTEVIPAESAEFVYEVALRTAVTGNLYEMAEALKNVEISPQLATELCRWLPTRAKSLITRDERIKLGLTEAIWVYSGAPCLANPSDETSKSRDEAHRLANGQKFNVAEGLTLNGKITWPGYEQDCKCSSRSVLPF